mmetsp:Transcript_41711/g.126270  ORF Transcript_41711/g.126270 Transcript_41711/m.126270 type:complete len:728 (-) Transcript_41711:130-2313(-)
MRVFVNNVDGYLAGAICADLWKLSHHITGTQKGSSLELVPPMVKKLVPRIEVRRLLKAIAQCDVVIYDLHDADLEELELVLRTLHISELPQDMVFILISSVGTWARTQREYEFVPDTRPPPEQEGGGEQEAAPADEPGAEGARTSVEASPALPRRPVVLKCEDYIRRVPTPKFQEWKTIETLVLALKEKGTIRPYVVCAGVPYGNGEDAFLSLFKAAWQCKDSLRVISSGHNYIPTVHVRDAARLVRHLLEERPALEYHLAVDRGDLTQRALVQAAADEFGVAYDIEHVSVLEAILAEFADILTIDLRLEPSPLMGAASGSLSSEKTDDGKGTNDGSSAEGGAEGRSSPFRWWCEEGLAANVGKVAGEFRRWRRLQPVRFCVLGPPGSGADEFGARLAERYNVPSIAFDDIVEEQRNTDTPLGQQLRDKLDEIATALGNPKSQGPFLLPSSLTVELVEAYLQKKPAQYRGFVLSGYPQTLEECTLSFLEEPPPPEPLEGEEATAPEAEKVPRKSVAPDMVVAISSTDATCLERLQSSEKPVVEKEFQLKMDRWKKENPEDGPALLDFFEQKFECGVLKLDASEVNLEEDIANVSLTVESKRSVINFLPPAQAAGPAQAEEEPSEEVQANVEELARAEAEARKRRKEQEERLEQIKREEYARLEKHSEPLRQYMMNLVVPMLCSGLVEVCRNQPEDPVGYLAEYLSVYAEQSRKRVRPPSKMALQGAS